LTGKGFMRGTQYLLGYLPRPVAPTDFIFSVIAEETGFVGAALVTVLLVCVILCSCRTAVLAPDELGTCLALGSATILATHTLINVGMTVQAAPIIGIPLPFVSYGGSFMFSTMALAGLCQSVHIRRSEKDLDTV
jgi:rod shape determining protein RodA